MTDPVAVFLSNDYRRWIFPLRTPLVLAVIDSQALRDHITQKILNSNQPDGFVTGQVAFSRKDVHHLRRVFVLDPIATFFIYDFVQANRRAFPRPSRSPRSVYGHGFVRGVPANAFAEYHAFRRRKYALIADHGFFAQLDVFNCFNSFYHHNVTSFITGRTAQKAGAAFGQFLRELNGGDSIGCFPQGLYPAKVLGNAYLSFLETSRSIRVGGFARFLDDIVLADQSRRQVEEDALEIQHILGTHHLSLNDAKTVFGEKGQRFQERKLDRIKRDLLAKREAGRVDYDNDDEDIDDSGLTERERDYLLGLIRKPNVAQEDVELALRLLDEESDALELLVDPVLEHRTV